MKTSFCKICALFFIIVSLCSNVISQNLCCNSSMKVDIFRDLIVILDDKNKLGCDAITTTLLSAISSAQYPILVSSTVWSNFVLQRLQCKKEIESGGGSEFLDHINHVNNRINNLYNSLSKKCYAESMIKKLVAKRVNNDYCSIGAIEHLAQSGKLMHPESADTDDYLCYLIPFDEYSWKMFLVSEDFYLLVPKVYLKACGIEKYSPIKSKKVTEVERILGLKIDHLDFVKYPLKRMDLKSFKRGKRLEGEFLKALNRLFLKNCKSKLWNIYLVGHGNNSEITGCESCIANLKISEFKAFLSFLHKSISTNILIYQSCFAGGKHLITPYKLKNKSVRYNYPIVVTCLSDLPCSINLVYLNMISFGGKITENNIWQNKTTGKWELKIVDEANDWATFFNGVHMNLRGKECDTGQLLDTVKSINVNAIYNTPWIRFAGDDHFKILACPRNCAKIGIDLVNTQKRIGGFIEFKDSSIQYLFIVTPIVSVPVLFSSWDCCPEILSLVPGDATHNFVSLMSQRGFTEFISRFKGLELLSVNKTYLIKQLKCANDLSIPDKKYLGLTIDGMITLNDVVISRKGKNSDRLEVLFRIPTSKFVYSAEIDFYNGYPKFQGVHPFNTIKGNQYALYVSNLEKEAFSLLP